MTDTPDLPPPGPPGPPTPSTSDDPPTRRAGSDRDGTTGRNWRDELGAAGGDGASTSGPRVPGPPPADVDHPPGDAVDRDGDVGRTGLFLAVGVGLLVVVGLVAIVLQRDPVQLGLDTPEGTVQAWLQSVVDDQPQRDLLDPGSPCSGVDVGHVDDDIRARVLETTVDGDRATVELSVTEGTSSGPFDQAYSHDERFELRRTGDAWAITAFEWPYDGCWNDELRG